MKKVLIFCVLLLPFAGCVKSSIGDVGGDLYVTVTLNNTAVEHARVYTKPETNEGITDEFGTVTLKGIDIGSIEVYAVRSGIGSGKTAVYVKADNLVKATVKLTQK